MKLRHFPKGHGGLRSILWNVTLKLMPLINILGTVLEGYVKGRSENASKRKGSKRL